MKKFYFAAADRRLRLVWRLTLYFTLFLGIAWIAHRVIRRLLIEEMGIPLIWGNLLSAVFYISAALALTAFFRRRIDRRSWSGMALGPVRG